jgi:mRNA interferase HigB
MFPLWELVKSPVFIGWLMKVIGKILLDDFSRFHSDVRKQAEAWLAEAEEAEWKDPIELQTRYPSASILKNRYVVFNLKSYRLLARISYTSRILAILRVGTHEEYDKWNLKELNE